MKVGVLIAGYQKCGTTALHTFLSVHPKIIGSSPKELDYFNYKENFNKGDKYYHTHFKNKPFLSNYRGYQFMEASPSYATDADVVLTAKRIQDYNKNIKIILLVRNPIERAYSAWNMYRKLYLAGDKDWWFKWVEKRRGEKVNAVRRNKLEYNDFTLFIKNEIECLSSNKPIECPILSHGHYYKGIEVFQKFFKEQLLVLSNESLNTNTSSELFKIGRFLKLDTFDWGQFEDKKVFKGVYESKIPIEANEILKLYYKDSNEKLKILTYIDY
jgi:hypothetical protein